MVKAQDHFRGKLLDRFRGKLEVDDITHLAQSSYRFHARGVYKGPRDCNDKITYKLLFRPKFRLLRTNGITKYCYSLTLNESRTVILDMGLVSMQ